MRLCCQPMILDSSRHGDSWDIPVLRETICLSIPGGVKKSNRNSPYFTPPVHTRAVSDIIKFVSEANRNARIGHRFVDRDLALWTFLAIEN